MCFFQSPFPLRNNPIEIGLGHSELGGGWWFRSSRLPSLLAVFSLESILCIRTPSIARFDATKQRFTLSRIRCLLFFFFPQGIYSHIPAYVGEGLNAMSSNQATGDSRARHRMTKSSSTFCPFFNPINPRCRYKYCNSTSHPHKLLNTCHLSF